MVEDAFIGYQDRSRIFLPLAEFVKTLKFPIKITDDSKKASGWFIAEKNKFALDLNKNQITVTNKTSRLDRSRVLVLNGRLLVDSKLLEKWFNLTVTCDPLGQVVDINSDEELPILSEMARKEKWDEVNEEKKREADRQKAESKIKIIKTPYRLASIPITDIRFRQDYNSKPGSGASKWASQADILFDGDLLYLNNQLFATVRKDGVNDGVSNVRLTSGRKDPTGHLLGPLHATDFTIGDVYTPQLSLVSMSQIGRGALVTNYPTQYVTDFSKVPIIGNMQPGWEVELYRNDVLLNFQVVGPDGIYNFPEVPLVSSLNTIRLVFYGPYGQRREEIRKFLVNSDVIKKGKFYYRFTGNQHNQTLIKTGNNFSGDYKDPRDGAGRYSGELSYGLLRNTSLLGSFTHIPILSSGDPADEGTFVPGAAHNYVSTGIRSTVLGMYGGFDLVNDVTGKARAAQTNLQTRLFDYDFNLRYDQYQTNFVSEEHQYSPNPIANRATTRLNGKLPFTQLNFFVSGIREHFKDGQNRLSLDGEIPFTISQKLNLTQGFSRVSDDNNPEQRIFSVSRTLLNYRFSNQFGLRGSLNYNLKPRTEFSSYVLTADYRMSNTTILNLNASHQFPINGQPASDNYTANLSKTLFNKYIVSVGAGKASTGAYNVSLNFSLSFGYDPKYKTGATSGVPIASSGAVAARVFIDENNNGIYNKNERLVEGAGVEVENCPNPGTTNKNGVVFIAYVPTTHPVKVRLMTEGINDPYLTPKREVVKVMARSGAISNIDFALVPTGEINGTVKAEEGRDLIDIQDLKLELVDKRNGRVIQTVNSAYDGFYSITQVPYGKYQLRLAKSELKRLDLKTNPARDVVLNKKTSEISDFSITLKLSQPEVKPSIVAKEQSPTPKSVESPESKSQKGKIENIVDDLLALTKDFSRYTQMNLEMRGL